MTERGLSSDGQSVTRSTQKRPLPLRAQHAFAMFPRIYGGEPFELDEDGMSHLRALYRARTRIAHSDRLEDYFPSQMRDSWEFTPPWFFHQLHELLSRCLVSVGEHPLGETQPPAASAPASEKDYRVFSRADMKKIKELEERTWQYFKDFNDRAVADFTRAGKLLRANGSQGASPAIFRLFVRAYAGGIEGVTNSARVWLEHGAHRGDFNMTDEELKDLRRGPILDRHVATMRLYAREIGQGFRLPARGKDYEAVKRAISFRDRITHPKLAGDAALPPRLRPDLPKLVAWEIMILKSTVIDVERFAERAR